MRVLALATAAFLAVPAAASASSSAWFETEGARIRLVTTGLPDATGRFNGALQVELEPGWKTYWRDPGDAGVPPSIDVSASPDMEAASFSFPPPVRIDDGVTAWAGYKQSVAFPVAFKAKPGANLVLAADVFLGICEAICVPVQARLEVDPGAAPDDADDAVTVKAALDALPEPAAPNFGVVAAPGGSSGEMKLQAIYPGAEAELFIAAPEGYVFAVPRRQELDGKIFFAVTILDRPDKDPENGVIPYTLVTSAGAVEGELPLPPRDCCKAAP